MKKEFILLVIILSNFVLLSQTSVDYYNSGLSKFKIDDYKGAILDFNKA
jgi:hypothetical protein